MQFVQSAFILMKPARRKAAHDGGKIETRALFVRILTAPFVVVTVPVGVLAGLDAQSVLQFVPPLAAEKVSAIQHLALHHCVVMEALCHHREYLSYPLCANTA